MKHENLELDLAALFWKRVSILMKKQGLGWKALADEVGMKTESLLSKKSRDHRISLDFAYIVAKFLHVTIDELCSNTDESFAHRDNEFFSFFNESTSQLVIHAYEARDFTSLKVLREKVFRETRETILAGEYLLDGRKIVFDPKPLRSTYYCHELKFKTIRHNYEHVKMEICYEDCLELAGRLASRNPLVLSMANRITPTNDLEAGVEAQESYLLRASNYSEYLNEISDTAYPINYHFGGIYSPGVTVFKSSEKSGYSFLEKPFRVNVVAVPAISKQILEKDTVSPEFEMCLEDKIRTILNIAIRKKHDTLILGTLGCTKQENISRTVAKLYNDILYSDPYYHYFKEIFFAIPNTYASYFLSSIL